MGDGGWGMGDGGWGMGDGKCRKVTVERIQCIKVRERWEGYRKLRKEGKTKGGKERGGSRKGRRNEANDGR